MKTTEKEKCFGKRLPYIAPEVEVLDVKIEKGYMYSKIDVDIDGGSNESNIDDYGELSQ